MYGAIKLVGSDSPRHAGLPRQAPGETDLLHAAFMLLAGALGPRLEQARDQPWADKHKSF